LAPAAAQPVRSLQPMTRDAGLHVQGLQLVGDIASDGSWVGANPGPAGSLARPGETRVYRYYAADEGNFLVYSNYDHTNGQLDSGLVGWVVGQRELSEWSRSRVPRDDLRLGTFTNDPAELARYHMRLEPVRNARDEPVLNPSDGRPLWTLT